MMKNHRLKSDSNTSDCLSHFLRVDDMARLRFVKDQIRDGFVL